MFVSKEQFGFTLIELSVVIIILGLLISGFAQAYAIYEARQKIELSELRMTNVNEALADFVSREGRLPCPAPMGGRDPSGSPRFNEEDCTTSNGNIRVSGTGGEAVLIGKYPAAILEVSNDHMRDVYNNYILYAVSENATDAATFAGSSGAITVREKGVEDDPGAPNAGEVIDLTTHNNVNYVVISMGSNEYGAYAYDGSQLDTCDSSINDEQENCDGDAEFVASVRSDVENTSLYYDDMAIFKSNVAALLPEEPTTCQQQEVFTTASTDCPTGWEEDNSLGNATVVNTTDGAGSHYNVDPDTGDYYFTPHATTHTQHSPTEYNFFTPVNSRASITCKKSESNQAKTRCSTKKVIVSARPPGYTNIRPSDFNEDKCPAGYRLVGQSYSQECIARATGREHNAGTCTNYRPVPELVCSQ